MRAVIYCRVSTKEQVENFSLQTQETACRQYCNQHGIEVDKVFVDEGESAKTINRPEFNKLIAYCKEHKKRITHVVVYSVNRFARDNNDHHVVRVALYKLGITLRSVTEPIDDSSTGKLMEGVLASFAQFDNDVRSERTIEGMLAALKKGRWTHQPPIGYKKPPSKDGPSLIPDSDRASRIKMAFELASSGRFSKKHVAEKLNALGFTTPKGKKLSPQTLDKILQNPIYAGWIYVPKWGVKERGDFKALISDSLYHRVNPKNSLGIAPNTPYERDNPEFPLRRLVKCTGCGKSISGSKAKGRYLYYHCPRCKGMSFTKERFEGLFLKLLARLKPNPDLVPLFREIVLDVWKRRQKEKIQNVAKLERVIRDREAKKAKLTHAFVYDEKISKSVFEIETKRLSAEIALAKSEIESCEKSPEMDVERILSFAEKLLLSCEEMWPKMDLRQKQAFQKAVFPRGLQFDGKKFGTTETSSIFSILKRTSSRKSKMASQWGLEPSGPYGS